MEKTFDVEANFLNMPVDKYYTTLEMLSFKHITNTVHKYYNDVDPSIRRNESYRTAVVLKQVNILELDGMHLISRLHIEDMKVGVFCIAVAEKLAGPYITIEKNLYIPHGKERVVKIGSLPGRYIKITMMQGSPILDISKVKIFGMPYDKIKSMFGKDVEETIYKAPLDILYS